MVDGPLETPDHHHEGGSHLLEQETYMFPVAGEGMSDDADHALGQLVVRHQDPQDADVTALHPKIGHVAGQRRLDDTNLELHADPLHQMGREHDPILHPPENAAIPHTLHQDHDLEVQFDVNGEDRRADPVH
jgi:hypothetical protein